ncbi:MAG: transposase [Desulfitobacterium sp.]
MKQIDAKLAATPEHKDQKRLRKAKRVMLKDYLPRMKKYEKQEELLAERNSYSKTDTDTTFMRMKEDAMRNGQLKPGYNVQMGTENQFVVGYSIHQSVGDTGCMKEHLEELKKNLGGKLPSNIVADAGYGSEDYLPLSRL